MYSIELSKQLLKELWKRKVRTFLSVFGVFWGTVSVVLLLSLGSGYYKASVKSLSAIADGALLFYPGTSNLSYRGYPAGMKINIKANTIMHMGESLVGIKEISPVISSEGRVAYKNIGSSHPISGVSSGYPKIAKISNRMSGYFFNTEEVREKSFVVVLGSQLKENLFGKKNPLGEKVTIFGTPFTVVGTIDLGSGMGAGSWTSLSAFIPYTTLIEIKGNSPISSFSILPTNTGIGPYVTSEVRDYLGGILNFNPADKSALNSPDLTKMLHYFTTFFLIIEIFLGFCGLLTLTVGGISVANMMFLVVTERTREIGLRMALGAKPLDIVFVVMIEAFLTVFIGGAAGVVFSFVSIEIINLFPLPAWIGSPEINVVVMMVTVIVLLLVSFLAGIFPAKSASGMEPVEALSF